MKPRKKLFIEIAHILQLGGRRNLAAVMTLALIGAMVEAIGVGSVMPFIAVAADPNMVEKNSLLQTINNFVGLPRDQFIVFLGAVFIAATLMANILSAANTVSLAKYSGRIFHVLSSLLLRRVVARPYVYFLNVNTAEINALILTSTKRVTDGIIMPVITMASRGTSALFIYGVLVWSNPTVALYILLIIVPIYAVTYHAVRERLNDIGAEIAHQDKNCYRCVNEALSGIKDLKILGRTNYVTWRFEKATRALGAAQASGSILWQTPKYLIESVGVIAIVFAILWSLNNNGESGTAISLAALYAYAGYRLLPAAQAIFGSLSIIRHNVQSVEPVIHELRSIDADTMQRKGPASDVHHMREVASPTALVVLNNVSFRYPGQSEKALDSVSISIPRGSHIGIVGSSGSGKSTLLDIMVGLLHAESGQIYFDGALVDSTNNTAWTDNIGYVPQVVFLSDGTIAENIAFGVPPELIDESRILIATKVAQIHDFIVTSLPDKYATQIGERGVRLSGGQRQRLGIARAVYHDPDLLILDEATNALDTITEEGFMETVKGLHGKKTVISVAHRLSTVRGCDIIYVFSHGTCVATGTYDHLEKTSRHFQGLIMAANKQQT
jgi:ATP-binding cassette, subfamily B, bacterial PglK